MSANFTPTLDGYTGQQPFKYWCQTVLPLVYDDSLSYYELLNKVVAYLNNVIADVSAVEGNVDALLSAYQQLQKYVNDYFDNLDVQGEINNKLDEMAEDGTLSQLIFQIYGDNVSNKFADSTAEMIDTKSNYVLTTNSHIYYYSNGAWNDSGVVYGAVNESTLMYRGNITGTTFYANNLIGFYNFSTTDLANITDKPDDLTTGGILQVYKPSAVGATFQIIISTNGTSWFRYSNNEFRNIKELYTDNALKYNGAVSGTLLSSNNKIGFYRIPLASLTDFTDKPTDMTTSGTLFNYLMGAGVTGQTIIGIDGNSWFRQGNNAFIRVDTKDTIKNNGTVSGTLLSSNNKIGFYSIPLASLTDFTDKPTDMTTGGTLFNYLMGAGVTGQTIIGIDGNSWFRQQTNSFKNLGDILKPFYNKRNVVWYALGDSITQGFTGANGEITGLTNNNYVTNVASLNGYTFVNYGVGGSGYNHNGTVLDQLNARDKVDTINFANCDLVTLAFGVNDWHYNVNIGDVSDSPDTGGTMCSNMKYCIEKILTDNPYAKIIVLTPLNASRFGGDFSTNWGLGHSFSISGTLANIIDKQKAICEYYGIEYIEQTKSSIVNRYNIEDVLGDGLHPTAELYPILAKDLASKINFK